jgi:hypothetical protein
LGGPPLGYALDAWTEIELTCRFSMKKVHVFQEPAAGRFTDIGAFELQVRLSGLT